ncbi:hypothetical protein D3C81_1788750 [compost metagenome]
MRANFIDDDQLRLIIVEAVYQGLGCRHVAIQYRCIVELHELVDVLFFSFIHAVLQVAAGALGVDIHRRQACLLRVLPD